MATLAQFVAEWQNFYMLLGGAAATLAGLLFVALSIDATAIHRPGSGHLQGLARVSFTGFLNLLFIALIMIAPHMPIEVIAMELAAVGAVLAWGTLRAWFAGRATLTADDARKDIARSYLQTTVCGLGLIAVSLLLFRGQYRALYWLLAPTAGLLMTAARNAWLLLKLLGARSAKNTEI
ncbi:MAG TPA: hypothetical protein VKU00_07985 [Chthonomonadaceae bacterium]|nr:hypothetical protein [Chthonomonadaceae bacterium]